MDHNPSNDYQADLFLIGSVVKDLLERVRALELRNQANSEVVREAPGYRNRNVTPELRAEMVRLYGSTGIDGRPNSLASIGRALGYSHNTVRKQLQNAGVIPPAP